MRCVLLFACFWFVLSVSTIQALTFEERVEAQRAIERVYYNHRIWPKENSGPKPPFEQMVPDALIREKVQRYLKESSALESHWHRPLTGEQLQAEMNRIVVNSKDPDTLRELMEALKRDPALIAECLARPVLARRQLASWYSQDEDFNHDLRNSIHDLQKRITVANISQWALGDFQEVRIDLDESKRLSESDPAADFPDIGKVTLQETDDAFIFRATKIKTADFLEGSVRIVPRTSLDAWLERADPVQDIPVPSYPYSITQAESLSGQFRPDSWALESYVPASRFRHSAIWTGSEMIIWGGNSLNSGGRYSPSVDQWTPLTLVNAPAGRELHSAIWTGSEMIIWGGNGGGNTGGRYNPVKDQWTTLPTNNAPVGRFGHVAVWTGQYMIVWGGSDGSFVALNSGGRYDPQLNVWFSMTLTNAPSAREEISAVWTGSEMIVWGGRNDASVTTNTGGRYNPLFDAWTPTNTVGAPTARSQHTSVWTGSEMIVWGGSDDFLTEQNSGGRYNPATNSWGVATSLTNVPTARNLHTAVWTGTEMMVWGGRTGGSTELNDGGRFNPQTNSWLSIATINAPVARQQHSAIWSGSEMIVWGGLEVGLGALPSGGRYNPALNSWVPTAAGGGPNTTTGHTLVWTGVDLIAWGGANSNSGGRYNVAMDTWTPTTTLNAPVSRGNHTAVWTGTEMIVWGGITTFFTPVNSGGRYNPISDSWVATTLVGAPTQRFAHTAAWTGSEMIIWGGSASSAVLNTGARYNPNPLGDSWTPTTSASAPTARTGHTALWTGTQMIIWGGSECTNPPTCSSTALSNSGAYYQPDNWSPITLVGAPTPRNFHSAVWTGSSMMVWGGFGCTDPGCSTQSYLNDGAELSSGVWFPIGDVIPPDQAPEGRSRHTAVWSSAGMIVWGGANAAQSFADGGIYSQGNWTPLPTLNAPLARFASAAVWTGQEMILFGGFPETGLGIYYPNTPPTSSPVILNPSAQIVLGGSPDTLQLSQSILGVNPPMFFDNVENGDQFYCPFGCGEWHRVSSQNCSGVGDYYSPTTAWYFGNSTSCSYDSTPGFHTIASNSFYPVDSHSVLTFRYLLNTGTFNPHPVLTASDTPVTINDLSTVSSQIVVPFNSQISDINVNVSIRHTSDGDLVLTLIGPDNTQVVLSNRRGGSGDNFGNTTFDDAASTSIASGVAPFYGYYIPENSLSAFNGHLTAGTWRLQVQDAAGGNVGTIDSFSLFFSVRYDTNAFATVEIQPLSGFASQVAIGRKNWLSPSDGIPLEDSSSEWHMAIIPLGAYAGDSVQVRFTFTANAGNGSLGWLIDDIGVGWPAADGSSASTTIPYHDKWDNARFYWYTNGDGIPDNPDPSTPIWNIPESDLAIYGLGQPGTYFLGLKVVDSLNAQSGNTVMLTVLDGVAPSTNAVIPNGGESWAYSADTLNRQKHLIVWNASDNFPPLSRAELSYSADGVNYTCIADSSGAGCPANGLAATATSYLWSMPTQAEAAAAGQSFPSATARLRVEVWDGNNNAASDISDNNFYIIQPTTSAIKTLVLWNSARIASQYGIPAKDALGLKLAELSDHNKINGFVLDLASVPAVQSAFASWDADPTNQAKANAVAGAIRTYILDQVTNTFTETQYLILAGDDTQIPQYRMQDGTTFYTESNYPAQVGLNTGTTVGSAINAGYFLSDNYYSELSPEPTGLPAPHDLSYQNDIYIGRLVETPAQIESLINTYLAQDGQVNVTAPTDKVLVAGHDFLFDSGKSIRDAFVNPPNNKTTDVLLDDPDTAGDEYNAAALQAQLLSTPAHRIVNLNDHANHFSFSTSTGSLDATTLNASAVEMSGSILYSPGCHSGLNVPSSDSHALDLPELMSRKKVVGYVGNTGYGWGLRYGTGLSEKLMELMTDEMLQNGTISVGKALSEAKRSYHILENRYDVFDEKVEHELTLYGIPNYLVVTSIRSQRKIRKLPSASKAAESGCAQGICVQKDLARAPATIPPGVTELNLNFQFGAGTYQLIATPDGQYYTLNGQSSGETGEPIQPHFAYDSALSGTVSHGVLFTGGGYSVTPSFNPVIAVPRSTNGDSGEGPIPLRQTITPQMRQSTPSTGGRIASAGTKTNLTVHTGIWDKNSGDEALFNDMQFVVYYSNSGDSQSPVIADPGVNGFHTVNGSNASFSATVTDNAGVFRVLVTYNDVAAGQWKSLDLSFNAGTGKWEGSLQLSGDILYFVQAVDINGNVGILSEGGNDLDANGQPYGSNWSGPKVYTIGGNQSFLFFDDFEDNDVTDWTPTKGAWTAAGGSMLGTFNKKADNFPNGFAAGCSTCTIEADMQINTAGARVSLLGWYVDKHTYVELRLMEDKDKVLLKQYIPAGTAAKQNLPMTILPNTNYHVKISYSSGTFQVDINGAPMTVPTAVAPSGIVGFRIKSTNGGNATGVFRQIAVY